MEEDVNKLSRYIEFHPDNFNVFSIELVRLYLSICSEVDVVIKELCKKVTPESKTSRINEYKAVIKPQLDTFINQSAISSEHIIHFMPWKDWNGEKNPEWWTTYNKVKHNRTEHYSKATLKNVLEALAALYVVNLYLSYMDMKNMNPTFSISISDAVRTSPRGIEFYRIDDAMAYMTE